MVKNPPVMQVTQLGSLGQKIPWRRAWPPTVSTLTWNIPGTEETGRLRSTGLHRVGHNRSDQAAAASGCSIRVFKMKVME